MSNISLLRKVYRLWWYSDGEDIDDECAKMVEEAVGNENIKFPSANKDGTINVEFRYPDLNADTILPKLPDDFFEYKSISGKLYNPDKYAPLDWYKFKPGVMSNGGIVVTEILDFNEIERERISTVPGAFRYVYDKLGSILKTIAGVSESMKIEKALDIIADSGLVTEKMTEEEKAAKRKARREARKAEEKAYNDAHWFFDLNVRGGGCYSMLYDLVKYMSKRLEGADFRCDTEDQEWVGLRWYKNDNAGKEHSAAIYFDEKYPKDKEIYAELYVDGDDTEKKYEYRDSEGTSHWTSMRLSNLNYHYKEYARGRTSDFDFEVVINKKDWIEYVESMAKRAKDALERKVNLSNEEADNSPDRKIPDFKYVQFEFTEDPIDWASGKPEKCEWTKERALEYFHKLKGEDNNSYADFKEFLDNLDIEYLRTLEQEASLFRGGFSMSQYWFTGLPDKRDEDVCFRGYEHDDVKLTGWKFAE